MIIRALFEFAIGLLPTVNLSPAVASGFATAYTWISFANYYLPIDTLLTIIGIYFAAWIINAIISAVLQLL